ncbi:DNA-binding protein [Burkholderia sp. K24]|nr:DNA-binding protein [Burkholderia sp. K24]
MRAESCVPAEQVAEHFGMAKHTVNQWRERKGLSVHEIGRLRKFLFSEVDGWVRVGGSDESQKSHGTDR